MILVQQELLQVRPGFWGRASVVLKFVKMCWSCIQNFFATTDISSPVTVEAIECINLQVKMIKYEAFSHIYFATPPITRSCASLDSLGKLGFRA